ncbi:MULTISPECIES: TonB-dependent receptor [unclassified Sulfitobacter]|uniref:TonB-dependent receptor domain-containing protein n=1 Tax=unclassified Sulfitobacter TaxID=196795 RepID=UPI0023E3081C|nr:MULTISPECIES: TonB-dependent receptor [unclassified Sulfitobacter]
MHYPSLRACLRASTAAILLLPLALPVAAQDTAAAQDLGTLVLGQSKRDVETKSAVSKTTIDQTEILDRQAGTVAELFDSVPGVALVNGATAQGSGINIRGFGANSTFGTDQKVLIQIDGATKGSEELYRIGTQLYTDPFLYREVEVLRGTIGSFEYGSGVFGGTVLLETVDASDLTAGNPGFAGRQTFEYNSNGEGFVTSTILAYQMGEDAEFLLNYTRRMLDVREDGDGNKINPAAGAINDPSWLLKGKFHFGEARDHSLTVSLSETEQESSDVPYDTFGKSSFGNVDRFIENRVASLRYSYTPEDNDLVDLSVELTYSDEVVNSEAVDRTLGRRSLGLLDADNRYETTTLRLKNTALFATGGIEHELRAGLEFVKRERKDAKAGSAPGGTKDVIAVFAVDEMQFGENFTLTPALRYETQTIKEAAVNGTDSFDADALMGGLSARYAFGNGWAVYGSAAYTENLPIVDDILNPVLINQSEKGTIYEIGTTFDRESVFQSGDTLAFRLGYYKQDLRDLTTYGSFTPGASLVAVERDGWELEAAYAMDTGYYVDLNAHVSDGTSRTESGVEAGWRQNPQDTLRLTLGKKWGQEWDVSWETEFAADYKTAGTVTDDGYTVHNLRATWIPQSGVLEGSMVRFGVENVTDRQYTPRLSTRPAAGRNFKVSLSTTF